MLEDPFATKNPLVARKVAKEKPRQLGSRRKPRKRQRETSLSDLTKVEKALAIGKGNTTGASPLWKNNKTEEWRKEAKTLESQGSHPSFRDDKKIKRMTIGDDFEDSFHKSRLGSN